MRPGKIELFRYILVAICRRQVTLLQRIDVVRLRACDLTFARHAADHGCDGAATVQTPAMQRAPGQPEASCFEPRHVVPRSDRIERLGRHSCGDIEYDLVRHEARLAGGRKLEPAA